MKLEPPSNTTLHPHPVIGLAGINGYMTEESILNARDEVDREIDRLDGNWVHLNLNVRGAMIAKLIKKGVSRSDIAESMGVTVSSLTRPLRAVGYIKPSLNLKLNP